MAENSEIIKEDEFHSSESEFNDGYESDLMGDEKDREALANMTEKEREYALFTRAEKRDELRKIWLIRKKLNHSKQSGITSGDDAKVRSRNRKKNVELNKNEEKRGVNNAMARLKAKREKKQKKSNVLFETITINENQTIEQQFIPEKIINSCAAFEPEFISRKDQLDQLKLSRHKLEKMIDAPNFDEIVVGCFIRVNIETKVIKDPYHVAEIIKVFERNVEYDLGAARTKKVFKINIGEVGYETVRLEFVSNG